MFVLMSEPSQKCENKGILKQNYTKKLISSFKISFFRASGEI